jgi:hypothetical protein
VQLYSILVITIIFPFAVRALMARLGLNEIGYIMLFIYALALFTLGYPFVGAFTLIYVVAVFFKDYASLE